MVLEMQREPEEAGLRNWLLEEAVRERDHRRFGSGQNQWRNKRVRAGQNQREQEKLGINLSNTSNNRITVP